ncbi:MAG: hypothetical protein ABI169_16985 [Chitinophagaceae bacterium]
MASCIKEDATSYRAYLKNATSHSILVLPHKNGRVLPTDTIRLVPEQEIVIAEGSERGIKNHGGFHSKYLSIGSDDSVIVVFDAILSVSHYVNLPTATSAKYLKFESLRNILNGSSYDYTYKDINKHLREATYRYTFVDSDYQFAKQ